MAVQVDSCIPIIIFRTIYPHRYEDVFFSVSRSPFIAKKYGHLLGESQEGEGDCDLDGGDTQVGPLHPLHPAP